MVVVPSGTFMMGSPADEPERRESEPQHRVTFARAFAIGKTEVTWDHWEACVRDRWCDGPAIDVALRTNEDGTRTGGAGRDRWSASAGSTRRISSAG
jgi:formylglycine-generating enzyme required for sulfatase activity